MTSARWSVGIPFLVAAAALSCGSPSVVPDASAGDASFADDFASRVRTVIASGGTASTCASPLPAVPVADPDAARAAVRSFIAGVRGVVPENLSVTIQVCGDAASVSCASTFRHDLYKSNGFYGQELYPLAQELESRGAFVEETIWRTTVNGVGYGPEVCLSGVVDGLLVGIVMFNDWQSCP